jgi:hypothetical protein
VNSPKVDFSTVDQELGLIECEPAFRLAIEQSLKVDLDELNVWIADSLRRGNPAEIASSSSQQIDRYNIDLLAPEPQKPDASVGDLMSCKTFSTKLSSKDCFGNYEKSLAALQRNDPEFAHRWNQTTVEACSNISFEANTGSDLIIKLADNLITDTYRLNVVITDLLLSYFYREDFVLHGPLDSFVGVGTYVIKLFSYYGLLLFFVLIALFVF